MDIARGRSETRPRRYSFDVIGRAIMLLELISQAATPLGVSGLARGCQIPKTTAHRLIGMLADYGLVDRSGGGFVPGARMRRLAALVHNQMSADPGELLAPYLVELYEQTGDVVTLGVLDGRDMVVLDSVRGLRHRGMPPPPRRSPAHCTAIGKLLLAQRHDVSMLYRAGDRLTACTQHSVPDVAALLATLDQIRAEGVATSVEEHVPGVVDIAVPVFGRGGVVAGLARTRPAGAPRDDAADVAHRQVAFSASVAVRRHGSGPGLPRQPGR